MPWWSAALGTARRLLVSGLLVGGLLGAGVMPAAAQVVSSDLTTITVSGTGVATAPAETARIQIMVGSNAMYGAMPGTGWVGVAPLAPPAPISPAPTAAISEAAPPTAEAGAVPTEAASVTASPAAVEEAAPAMAEPALMDVTLTPEDLAPIVDAIVAEGVAADAVTVITGPAASGWYGPGSAGAGIVEATVTDPTLVQMNAIIDAATAAAGSALMVQQVGVEYGLADCAALIDASRAAAFEDGRARAEGLAQHFGATVEAPVQVSDFSTTIVPVSTGNGCPPAPEVAYLGAPNQAFNTAPFNPTAPAEARVVTQLSITYEYALAQQ